MTTVILILALVALVALATMSVRAAARDGRGPSAPPRSFDDDRRAFV